ncbi:periphilin-1 [Scophthalmus maximus]|uniref:Periphilin 1 n=1 Tax=Scophthalmus maximus TaxID=52904 RepID=A0A8D3A605_SCOMX|nr:periphilin-1 [Scophthalmus maximus]
MAYRHGRKSIREVYEHHFSEMDSRELNSRRVVNIVEKRSLVPRPELDYDGSLHDDQWYGGPRNYHNAREYHGEDSYPPSDAQEYYGEDDYPPSDRYYPDETPNYGNYQRHSSPVQNEGPHSQQCYSRHDLRYQLESGSRNNGRPAPYSRSRGRGVRPPRRQVVDRKAKGDHDYRSSPPVISRPRSPGRREALPPGRSGSNSSNRSFSPDKDKGYTYQQAQQKHKANVPVNHTPSNSVEGSPQSSGSSKEKTPASVVESEEVPAASMEPKPTPEDDLKTCRLEAIKAKALEIEEHYRQDCETFRTVVKMLVAKEPSLDNLLQAPLDENLSEMKQRCLDALRHFVKELDEVLEQPDTSAKATAHITQDY